MILLTKVNNTVVINPILMGFGHKQVTMTLARASILGKGQGPDENRQEGLGREGSETAKWRGLLTNVVEGWRELEVVMG